MDSVADGVEWVTMGVCLYALLVSLLLLTLVSLTANERRIQGAQPFRS